MGQVDATLMKRSASDVVVAATRRRARRATKDNASASLRHTFEPLGRLMHHGPVRVENEDPQLPRSIGACAHDGGFADQVPRKNAHAFADAKRGWSLHGSTLFLTGASRVETTTLTGGGYLFLRTREISSRIA